MHHLPKAMQYRQAPWAIFGAIFFFTKLDAKEGQKTYRRRLYVLWYLHAELYGCGFKNVRPRVMYIDM